MSFFQNLGLAYGNSLIVGQEMADKQANIDLKQQQVAQIKLSNQSRTAETEQTKAIGLFIAGEQGKDRSTVDDPTKTGKLYQSAANMALVGGAWGKAKELTDLAESSFTQAKTATAAVEAKIHASREALATAAWDYQSNPTTDGAANIAKAAVAAGINPTSIPLPNTAEFPAWVKSQQQVALSSKDRVTAQETARRFDETADARAEEVKQRGADRLIAQQGLAASRESNELYRRDSLQVRKDAVEASKTRKVEAKEFEHTEKLNTVIQKEAAPYLKDREVLTSVKNLLAVDSAVADQQVQQALPSLLGSLKGRATNPYYKDNKYYGSLVDKLTDATSRAFSGRYSEDTRQQLHAMLDQMEKQNIDPVLTRLEDQQKKQAERYGLDPDKIAVKGDFNRLDAQGNVRVPKVDSAAPPTSDAPASERTRLEGDVAALKREIGRATGQGQLDILEPELRRAEGRLAAVPKAVAPTAAAASGTRGLPDGVSQSRVINGVTYHKKGTEWLPQ